MPAFLKVLIGLGLLTFLGVTGIHLNGGAKKAGKTVLSSVETSLAAAGHDWARIEADGQKITLYGTAPSQEARDKALNIARSASGPGGAIVGGVTVLASNDIQIDDSFSTVSENTRQNSQSLLPKPERFIWRVDYDGDSVTLAGYAPSETSKKLLYETAQKQFDGKLLSDETTLAQGVEEGSWLLATSASLKALSALERGSVAVVNQQLIIDGLAANDLQAEIARRLLISVPSPYSGDDAIEVRPPPAVEPTASTEALTLNAEEIATLCQSDIDEVMLGQQILFASNRASILADSLETLNTVATAIIACSPEQVLIEGHTDATGSATKNMSLSLQRAEAVKTYLITRDVDEMILRTKGFGETKPVASNATRSGRSINRRIEFVISVEAAH